MASNAQDLSPVHDETLSNSSSPSLDSDDSLSPGPLDNFNNNEHPPLEVNINRPPPLEAISNEYPPFFDEENYFASPIFYTQASTHQGASDILDANGNPLYIDNGNYVGASSSYPQTLTHQGALDIVNIN